MVTAPNILVKIPFTRITPDGYFSSGYTTDGSATNTPVDVPNFTICSQADFLREYYPSGHKINSRELFPDEWKCVKKKDKDGKDIEEWFEVPIERNSFPFQYIITIKQLTHLCGNLIKFTDTQPKPSKESKQRLIKYRQGWINDNMEIAFYRLAKSVKITGDGAFCMYNDNGTYGWRIFSYLNDSHDTLFPHYDDRTGKLNLFGRRYSKYDFKGKQVVQFLEVWDDKYFYVWRHDDKGLKGLLTDIIQAFGLDGWTLEKEPTEHGFNTIPIVYMRSAIGPCWSMSQDNIEKYEVAFSRLSQVNKTLAFPVLVITSTNVKLTRGDYNKPVASIKVDPGGDAKILNGGDASQSFILELNTLLKNIFMGSFVVIPPEERSGDESGVSIKIKYSPSIELAKSEAKEYDDAIDGMTRLYKFVFGMKQKQPAEYEAMDIRGDIVPYIHQNEAELMENLMKGVTAKFLSIESASAECPYSTNDEFERILTQRKDELGADITRVDYTDENKKTEVVEETEVA